MSLPSIPFLDSTFCKTVMPLHYSYMHTCLNLPPSGHSTLFRWADAKTAASYEECILDWIAGAAKNSYRNFHLFSDWGKKLLSEPGLLDVVYKTLEGAVALENSFLIVKAPESTYAIDIHQDGINDLVELDPKNSMTLWLSVDGADYDNGGLRIWPASQQNGYVRTIKGSRMVQPIPSTELPSPTSFDVGEGTCLSFSPGEGIAFSVALLHDSPPNRSPRRRIGLNLRFVNDRGIVRRASSLPPPIFLK